MRLGVPVYIPWGDSETADLIADFGGGLQRIQCKTSRNWHDGTLIFRLRHGSRRRCRESTYGMDEVDYFALCDPASGGVYLLPHAVAIGTNITLTMDDSKPDTRGKRHYASDYLLEDVVRHANEHKTG